MKFYKNKFLFFLVFFHVLFFVIKIYFGNFMGIENYQFYSDSYEYYQLSKNIKNSFIFYAGNLDQNIDPGLYTRRPPLYSIFILITSFILKSHILFLFFQNALSIISVLLIKKIFEINFGSSNRYVMYLFIATSINQFMFSNLIMSEIFFQFLLVLLLYQLHLVLKKKTYTFLIYYQLIIILLFITKPVFYLFTIPNILIVILLARKTKIKLGALSSIIPIVFVLVYCQWNYNRVGSYDFSSIQNVNLRDYNLSYFHTYKYGSTYAKEINQEIKNKAIEEDEFQKKESITRQLSLEYLKKEWIEYSSFHLIGCVKFFIDPGRYDLFVYFNLDPSKINEVGIIRNVKEAGITGLFDFLKTQPIIVLFLITVTLIFNLLKLIGCIWFWLKNYKKTPFVFWIMLVIIAYISFLTGPVGGSRFVVPILPFYLFFSIYGITDLLKKLKFYWTKTSLTSPSS